MELIKRNFEDFCDRSGADYDELLNVHSQVGNGAYLAGGALRRTLIKQPLDSDFDYFFDSEDHFKEWESLLPKTIVKTRETQHHSQYEGTINGSSLPIVVQAIKFKYYSNIREVLDSFDYTITQFCYFEGDLYTTPEALWDLGRRRLAIHKVTYPVATMRRMLKYSNQGFTACGGCMQTLFQKTVENPDALASMDITYVD